MNVIDTEADALTWNIVQATMLCVSVLFLLRLIHSIVVVLLALLSYTSATKGIATTRKHLVQTALQRACLACLARTPPPYSSDLSKLTATTRRT